jgi:catecholate siderophore receptor
MPRSFVFALVSAALLTAAPTPVEAQQQARPSTDSARAADSLARRTQARELSAMKVVGERAGRARYVVTSSRTATKTDTPLRDTPQSATVLTRSLIADQSMQSMADAVRFIPGVTMA